MIKKLCLIALITTGIISITACGKKGDLKPPPGYENPPTQNSLTKPVT